MKCISQIYISQNINQYYQIFIQLNLKYNSKVTFNYINQTQYIIMNCIPQVNIIKEISINYPSFKAICIIFIIRNSNLKNIFKQKKMVIMSYAYPPTVC